MIRSEVYTGLALTVLGILFLAADPLLLVIIIMLVVGIILLFHGFGIFLEETALGPRAGVKLGALDWTILEMVSQGSGQEEIAKKLGVAPQLVAEKSNALASAGYLKDNFLTEKGFEAVRSKK